MAGSNAHDPDAIVTYFTADAVFESPRGTEPGGARSVGREAIRAAFARRFAGIPDIRCEDDRHFVTGDRGASEWTIRGTTADGAPIEVRGCDLWEFQGALVTRIDSYWKRIAT